MNWQGLNEGTDKILTTIQWIRGFIGLQMIRQDFKLLSILGFNIYIWTWEYPCSELGHNLYLFLFTAVLTLYFVTYLHWDKDLSTAVYHAFSGLCYFTPILGALIADSWLGKFKWALLSFIPKCIKASGQPNHTLNSGFKPCKYFVYAIIYNLIPRMCTSQRKLLQ